jgi:hypothetical protein
MPVHKKDEVSRKDAERDVILSISVYYVTNGLDRVVRAGGIFEEMPSVDQGSALGSARTGHRYDADLLSWQDRPTYSGDVTAVYTKMHNVARLVLLHPVQPTRLDLTSSVSVHRNTGS